jgi:putative ABC transport system permease protein
LSKRFGTIDRAAVIMFQLALRNISRHKLRVAMTLAAIVFGVAGLMLSGGFVKDVLHQLGEATIHSQLAHVQVFKKGFYEQGSRSPEKYIMDDARSIADFIARMPEAKAVMRRLQFSGLLNNGKADWAVIGEGVEASKENELGTFMKVLDGRALQDDDEDGIFVGAGVAQALDLKPGSNVTILLNTSEGALNTLEFRVVGIFESFSKEFDERSVRISLAAAERLLGREGANSVVVELKRTEDTVQAANLIRGKIEGLGYEVHTWTELSDFYAKSVELYRTQFGVLQWIVLIMVLLSVFNTVNMSVFERVGEFGTLMALGNTRTYVFWLVIAENAVLGLLGAIVGVLFGGILAFAISGVGIPMPPPPNSNLGYTASIRLLPDTVLMAFIVGLLATLGAALLPARRVSRTPIIDALRYNI